MMKRFDVEWDNQKKKIVDLDELDSISHLIHRMKRIRNGETVTIRRTE